MMLVLTRKTKETIVIDGRITLEILQIQGERIRIGIQAPADIKILRGELMPFAVDTQHSSVAHRDRSRSQGLVADGSNIDHLSGSLARCSVDLHTGAA